MPKTFFWHHFVLRDGSKFTGLRLGVTGILAHSLVVGMDLYSSIGTLLLLVLANSLL